MTAPLEGLKAWRELSNQKSTLLDDFVLDCPYALACKHIGESATFPSIQYQTDMSCEHAGVVSAETDTKKHVKLIRDLDRASTTAASYPDLVGRYPNPNMFLIVRISVLQSGLYPATTLAYLSDLCVCPASYPRIYVERY